MTLPTEIMENMPPASRANGQWLDPHAPNNWQGRFWYVNPYLNAVSFFVADDGLVHCLMLMSTPGDRDHVWLAYDFQSSLRIGRAAHELEYVFDYTLDAKRSRNILRAVTNMIYDTTLNPELIEQWKRRHPEEIGRLRAIAVAGEIAE